jgi:hypothetical protein
LAGGVFLLVLTFHLVFYLHQPEVRRDNGWCTIVMHNWREYGYGQLNGQLVANPGGMEAGEKPFIYPRHRPTFLIIPYLLKELPGQAMDDGLLYDAAMLAMLFAGVMSLMGVTTRGMVTAAALCLTPGVFNNIMNVDTISTPALVGVAAMCFVCGIFRREGVSLWLRGLACVVLAVYMTLNWSSLFTLGVAAVFVLCGFERWKRFVGHFVAAGVVGLVVLVISLHHNDSTTATGGTFWNSYLWGPLGYDGSGMNFSKAFVRISAVNLIAWLPLVLAGLALVYVNGLGKYWTRAVWPVLAGVAAVFAMRNYNAHHPWGAVCIIGLGLVLGIELLVGQEPGAASAKRKWLPAALVAGLMVYLVAWLAGDQFNSRSALPVDQMVADHTGRHSLVVIVDGLLPNTPVPADLEQYQEEFDRKLMILEGSQLATTNLTDGKRDVYLLTHETSNFPGAKLVATSQITSSWAGKIMVPLFDFYRNRISRRAAGNRKTYYDEYQLYQSR